MFIVISKGIIISIHLTFFHNEPNFRLNLQIKIESFIHIVSFVLFFVFPSIFHRTLLPFLILIVYSFLFTVISQINHINSDCLTVDLKNDFLMDQVQTSVNYETNFITKFVSFGLNWQIEHHLFPSISHEHYHKITHIVKEFCKRNNVKYTSFPNMYEAFGSYYGHLIDMSYSTQ